MDDPLEVPYYRGSGSEAVSIRAELAAHPPGQKRYVLPRRLVYDLEGSSAPAAGSDMLLWASCYTHDGGEEVALGRAPGAQHKTNPGRRNAPVLVERYAMKLNPWDVEPEYNDNTFTGEIPYILPVPTKCTVQ